MTDEPEVLTDESVMAKVQALPDEMDEVSFDVSLRWVIGLSWDESDKPQTYDQLLESLWANFAQHPVLQDAPEPHDLRRLVYVHEILTDQPPAGRLALSKHAGHRVRIVTLEGTGMLECLDCDLFLVDDDQIKAATHNE